MQNGGLGVVPVPPGHNQGIQKFSPVRLKPAGLGQGIITL
jgi:hypothetical protein